jgi:hypothetical protein
VDTSIKVTFDDSKLKELQRKLKDLKGEKRVALPDLLPDDFIRKNTDFKTLQAMIDASGVKNQEEIGNDKFSKFIATHTRFSDWEEMLKTAGAEYYKRQLGL